MQQEITKDNIILLSKNPHYEWKIGDIILDRGKYRIEDKWNVFNASIKEEVTATKYMYITDKDAPIKEGVRVFHKGSKGDIYYLNTNTTNDFIDIIKSVDGDTAVCERVSFSIKNNDSIYPIIGSNDPKLRVDGIVGISDEFLRAWVEVQDKEYKVMMETETKGICCTPMEGIRHHGTYCLTCDGYKEAQFPKLSNNQLVLSIIEEKQLHPLQRELLAAHSEEDSEIEAAYKVWEKEAHYPDVYSLKPLPVWLAAIEWYKSRQSIEAIAFAEWVNDNFIEYTKYPIKGYKRWYCMDDGKYSSKDFGKEYPFTEELYQEWLKTQTK